jgi:hypothetical protein
MSLPGERPTGDRKSDTEGNINPYYMGKAHAQRIDESTLQGSVSGGS